MVCASCVIVLRSRVSSLKVKIMLTFSPAPSYVSVKERARADANLVKNVRVSWNFFSAKSWVQSPESCKTLIYRASWWMRIRHGKTRGRVNRDTIYIKLHIELVFGDFTVLAHFWTLGPNHYWHIMLKWCPRHAAKSILPPKIPIVHSRRVIYELDWYPSIILRLPSVSTHLTLLGCHCVRFRWRLWLSITRLHQVIITVTLTWVKGQNHPKSVHQVSSSKEKVTLMICTNVVLRRLIFWLHV